MLVDVTLYEFLKNHETGLYAEKSNVVAYVHIPFTDIEEFVETVGSYHFDEGGVETRLFENTLCVELNDVFDGLAQPILNYASCFESSDVKHYDKELKQNKIEWESV